jgi:topoisomerase IA-like protein
METEMIVQTETIGRNLMRIFKYRGEHSEVNLEQACTALAIPVELALQWIEEDKFAAYLAQSHELSSDISQAIALEELPHVVQAMADVATGRRRIVGSNPQAAAEFVLKVAQMGAHAEERIGKALSQVNIYMPALSGQQPEATAQIINVPY